MMDRHLFLKIVRQKPLWIVLVIISYIFILGLLRWKLTPEIDAIFYLFGGLLGIYFLDFADILFNIHPSPYKSVIFSILFGIVSFFVITSSGNMFACGLVLSIYFSLLLLQAEEWQRYHNLNRWYALIKTIPAISMQRNIILLLALLLVLETLIFIK